MTQTRDLLNIENAFHRWDEGEVIIRRQPNGHYWASFFKPFNKEPVCRVCGRHDSRDALENLNRELGDVFERERVEQAKANLP